MLSSKYNSPEPTASVPMVETTVAGFVNSKRVCGLARKAGLERIGGAHRISDLVIRRYQGEYVLAAFLYYYTSEDMQAHSFNRPSEWILMDFVTGSPLKRFQCTEKDFSDAPFTSKYNANPDGEYDLSVEFYRATYALLDKVRVDILEKSTFNKNKYLQYFKNIMENTPRAWQKFFVDLSDPSGARDN